MKLYAAEFFDQDDISHPADQVAESPFEPETERYGGTAVIRHSLDFFCLTSAYALQQIEHNRGVPKSRLLALGLRTLVRQALGFAADEDELLRLTAYVVNGKWQGRSPLEGRADHEFEERREEYICLFTQEIEQSLDSEARLLLAGTMLTDAALVLDHRTCSVSDHVRWRILSSQLHMTWNRMGIRNLEEIYLGRILWRAIRHVIDSSDSPREALTNALSKPGICCAYDFEPMINASLMQLAQPFNGSF